MEQETRALLVLRMHRATAGEMRSSCASRPTRPRSAWTCTVSPAVELPQTQPPCNTEEGTLLVDCGNWAPSARWQIPASAVSGLYFARLVRSDECGPGECTWRQDSSPVLPLSAFAPAGPAEVDGQIDSQKPGSDPRPERAEHAYGAYGWGALQNAIQEPRASHVYFVVRDDARPLHARAKILFQTADTTWHAYNKFGGANTYGGAGVHESGRTVHGDHLDPGNPARRAFKASLNRPLLTRDVRAINAPFGAEYPMIRWLERNGYDVAYCSGVDTDANAATVLVGRSVFLSVGHDEYWSGKQRRNVEEARDRGVHLAFFSGNEVFWRIRWEDNHRTMVVYKESQETAKLDPVKEEWTGTFRDGRGINPLGANPENALTGLIYTVNAWRHDPLVVPYAYSRLRLWRNTSRVSRLQPFESAILKAGLLGHEWDQDIDNGFRPPGLIRLSETGPVHGVMYLQDHGGTYDSGSATHHLVMHRAASGALVFGAGTIQWSWGLDAWHDSAGGIPGDRANPYSIRVGEDLAGTDKDVQQATVNIFAEMGAFPSSLQEGLVRASASTDVLPPSSRVRAVSRVPSGAISVDVTATDQGGGEVAGLEWSLDADRWHPAERSLGEASGEWRVFIPPIAASEAGGCIAPERLWTRAIDDSCNMEHPPSVAPLGKGEL